MSAWHIILSGRHMNSAVQHSFFADP